MLRLFSGMLAHTQTSQVFLVVFAVIKKLFLQIELRSHLVFQILSEGVQYVMLSTLAYVSATLAVSFCRCDRTSYSTMPWFILDFFKTQFSCTGKVIHIHSVSVDTGVPFGSSFKVRFSPSSPLPQSPPSPAPLTSRPCPRHRWNTQPAPAEETCSKEMSDVSFVSCCFLLLSTFFAQPNSVMACH